MRIPAIVAAMLLFAAAAPAQPLEPLPPEVWRINRAALGNLPEPEAHQTMIVTLQGLVNREGQPLLWYRHCCDPGNYAMAARILEEFEDEGVTIRQQNNPWTLVTQFIDLVDGYVLYQRGNDSINVATSLCGPLNAIAVTPELEADAQAAGLSMLMDVRTMTEAQALAQHGALFAPGIVVELNEDRHDQLRDFAVMMGAFTYFDGPTSNFRRTVVSTLGGPGTLVYGWGDDEYSWVRQISLEGGTAVPAGLRYNLSAMDRAPVVVPPRPRRYPEPAQPGEAIVAFTTSDGDNIRWILGSLSSDEDHWASPRRGQFPMTWHLGAMTAVHGSRGLRYFYENATEMDGFIASSGYNFPARLPDRQLYADFVDERMAQADQRVLTLINDDNEPMSTVDEILQQPNVMGILYKDWAPYNDYAGQIRWVDGKPSISYTHMLWEFDPIQPQYTPAGVAASIANGPFDPTTNTGSYHLVVLHAWSWQSIGGAMEAVAQTIDLLPGNVRVVTAEELVVLLRNNFGAPVPDWTETSVEDWMLF